MSLNGNDEKKEDENSWMVSHHGFLVVYFWLNREQE